MAIDKRILLVCIGIFLTVIMISTTAYLFFPSVKTGMDEISQQVLMGLGLEKVTWIIDEEMVYVDDDKVFISAIPHTLDESGYVTFEVKSKVYDGDVDIVFGFDTELLKPKKAELYKIHNETHFYTCTTEFFNYTTDPKHFYCYANVSGNGSSELVLIKDRAFEWGNLEEQTAYWNVTKEWKDYSHTFDSIDYDYQDMNKWWYAKNIPIQANQTYTFRVYIELARGIGFSAAPIDTKYWFAIKPSSESIQEAISNEHLYALDPWIDSSLNPVNKDYLDDNLTAGWNFSSGVDIFNSTVNFTTQFGTPTYIDGGLIEKNVYFKELGGRGATIVSASSDVWDLNTANRTLSYWFNATEAPDGADPVYHFQPTISTSPEFYATQGATTYVMKVCNTEQTITTNWDMDGSKFHHVVSVQNDSGNTIYLDGVKNLTCVGAGDTGAGTMVFGGHSSNILFYNGTIDEMYTWNTALNATAVSDLYAGGQGIAYNATPSAPTGVTATLNSPVDGFASISTSVIFNCSGEDNIELKNITLYVDDVQNYTKVLGGVTEGELYHSVQNFANNTQYNWTCEATDDENNRHRPDSRNFSINMSITQAVNKPTISEGEEAIFNLTLTALGINAEANLIYNNTQYSATTITSSTDQYNFTALVNIPMGTGNATGNNVSWYWRYNVTDWVNDSKITNSSQIVYAVALDNCSDYSLEIVNISLRDEGTDTKLNGTIYNSTIEVDATLTSRVDSTVYWTYNETFKNHTYVRLCIPDGSLDTGTTSYSLDLILYYKADSYVEEYYYVDNYNVSNSTVPEFIYLRDLLSTDSTTFVVSYESEFGAKLKDAVITPLRQYVGDADFKPVEAGKTDDNGETLLHLVEEDVIYKFNVTLNNVLVFLSAEYRTYCVAGGECKIELKKLTGAPTYPSYNEWDRLSEGNYNLTGNSSTRIISFIFNLNQTHEMNLTVFEYTSNQTKMDIPITSNATTLSSGELTVFIPETYSNTTFYVKLYKDNNWFANEIISLRTSPLQWFKGMGTFMSAIIVMMLIFMGLSTGAGVIIFALLGLAIAIILQMLEMTYAIWMYLACASTILIIKIAQRRSRP